MRNQSMLPWSFAHASFISCSTASISSVVRSLLHSRLRLFLERKNPLLRFCGIRRVGIQQLDFVVINQRAVPFLLLLIEFRDLETAVRLLTFKRGDYFIRLGNARIIRV